MDANLNLIRGFSFFSFFPPTLRHIGSRLSAGRFAS